MAGKNDKIFSKVWPVIHMECHSGKYSKKRFFDSKPNFYLQNITILFKIPIFNATFLFFYSRRNILIQNELFSFKTNYFYSKTNIFLQNIFFYARTFFDSRNHVVTCGFKLGQIDDVILLHK